MAHAGNGASRSRIGSVGVSASPMGLILAAIFLGPLVLFLAARRYRKQRENLWGDPRMAPVAIKPSRGQNES